MKPRTTAARVLRQLRAGRRSAALILTVPAVLLAAVHYLCENETLPPGAPRTFDRVGLIMPVVVVPQILLCGLFVPREQMNDVLEAVSGVLTLRRRTR